MSVTSPPSETPVTVHDIARYAEGRPPNAGYPHRRRGRKTLRSGNLTCPRAAGRMPWARHTALLSSWAVPGAFAFMAKLQPRLARTGKTGMGGGKGEREPTGNQEVIINSLQVAQRQPARYSTLGFDAETSQGQSL